MDKFFKSYNVEDRSYVAFVKRQIHSELLESNFEKSRIGEIDIIVSELTSNLIKHAANGELFCRIMNEKDSSIFEVITIDEGPGMTDVHRMMKDGVSTTNTLGHGLGSIQRLSDDFHIYSLPKWGTVSYTVVVSDTKKKSRQPVLEIKSLCVPKTSETFCGDGYTFTTNQNHIRVLFADGLGHGLHAQEAITRASDFFVKSDETDPVEIIRGTHEHVRKTRGMVATVAILDIKNKEWRICGVGNISTRIYGGLMFKHYLGHNGIIGLNIPNSLNASIIPAEKNQQLIMCSDGIRSRWDLSKYPSILKHDPMLLAAALFKDFNRRTDDSSVLVGKVNFDK
jgi:anti-sigma regulatory factor (Ser/Thr protein kinase)